METIQEGTKGSIKFYAKKHGKFITRSFLWTNLCRVMENYITYFDTDMKGYRTATRPVKMLALWWYPSTRPVKMLAKLKEESEE